MYKFILLISLMLPCSIFAVDTDKALQDANDLFEQGKEMALKDPDKAKKLYKSAAIKYQALVDNDLKNALLLKNLGNAYFSAGDRGRALLNFHRALRLDPSNEDIQHSIKFIRSKNVDQPPGSEENVILKYIFFWHQLPFSLRLAIFGLFNLITWGGLAFLLYNRKKILRRVIISAVVISVIFGGSLLVTTLQLDNQIDGIITESEVTPRQGNGYIYEMALTGPLHSGTEFKIIETRKNWYYVILSGGSKCWIPGRSATLIE